MEYYVYVYLDPRKPGKYQYNKFSLLYEPFYVGKGKENRLYEHLFKSSLEKNSYKNNKIKTISENYNIKNYIIKIKENLTEQESFDLEKIIIDEMGRFDLLKGLFFDKNLLAFN